MDGNIAGRPLEATTEAHPPRTCKEREQSSVKSINTTGNAIRALAAVCDGAVADDTTGFNAFDAGFGHALAARDEKDWTPKMRVVAYKMLRKYRGQLQNYGICYDVIPEPTLPITRQPIRQISLCNGAITVRFDYDLDLVEAIKGAIPSHSRKYDPATKIWEITPSAGIIESLIEYAIDNDFDVDDDVKELLANIVEEHKQLLEGSRAASSDYEITGLGGELYPFQRAGVEYAVKAERCFIADEMGLGKTLMALAVLHMKDAYPALVVCPATVKYNWALESLKWLPDKKVGMVKGRDFYRAQMANGRMYVEKDDHNLPGAYDIIIMNYDILKPQPNLWECHTEYTNIKMQTFKVGDVMPEPLRGFPAHTKELVKEHFKRAGYGKSKNGLIEKFLNINLAAIITDESHYTKSHRAQRSKACMQVAKGIPIRLGLTGTPILNRPSELISQLNILGRLNDLGGFWHFAERYCGSYHGRWGLDMSGAINLDELNTKMRGLGIYIRRTKSQVMAELPPKQQSDIMLGLDNREEYDKARDDLVAWLKQNARVEEEFLESISDLDEDEQRERIADYRMSAAARAARALQLTRIEHLKQLAAQGKLSMAIEWIRDFLETEEKLVVFAHHIEIQKALLAEFDGSARILGEDNSEVRQNNINRFQNNDNCRLIICSLKAGGIGITLTAASNVAFLELGWTPADLNQATDRLHRIGQKDSVMAWYLLANDSIDIDIQELINEKRIIVDAATEGEIADVSQTSILNDLVERLIQ